MAKNKHYIFLALSLLCCIALLVCGIISFIPDRLSKIQAKNPISVSSSYFDASKETTLVSVTGILLNTSDNPVQVEKMKIVLSNDLYEKTLELENITLTPRVEYEIREDIFDTHLYSYVKNVVFTIDGEEYTFRNLAPSVPYGKFMWFVVSGLFAYLAYLSICQLSYWKQWEGRDQEVQKETINGGK